MRHHLAILRRAYLLQILSGEKKIECRVGREGYPPHGVVQVGDLIWLKEVSGPVRAAVHARGVQCFRLNRPGVMDRIRRKYNDRIGAPAEFWEARPGAGMVTLISLGDLVLFQPFRVRKSDRRAWVPLTRPPRPDRALR